MSQLPSLDDVDEARTLRRTRALLLCSSLTVMAGATLAPALPAMQQSFQSLPDVALLIKLVMTLPALFIVLGAPLVGALLDRRIQATRALLVALALYGAAGTSGVLAAGSLHAILVGRALLGLAVAGLMTSGTLLASQYFQGPRLSQFMGMQAAIGGFGGVLFLLLGGLIAELGWRYAFLLYGAAFVAWPFVSRMLDEPGSPCAKAEPGASTETASGLPLPKLLLAYALALFEIAWLYLVPLHYPFFARSLEPVSSAQTGLAIAALMLVMAVVSALYKHISARATFASLHAAGLALLGVGYVALGRADSYLASYAGLAIAGLGLGLMRPNLMVWIMSFTPPPLRGRVFGGASTFFFLGQFASPLATAPSIARFGLGPTYAIAGGLALVLGTVFALGSVTRRARSPERAVAR